MKQTAVEWLEDCLAKLPPNGAFGWYSRADLEALFKQAKEMEKQQIIDAYDEGYGTRDAFGDVTENNTGEQHYTETYGKQIKTL